MSVDEIVEGEQPLNFRGKNWGMLSLTGGTYSLCLYSKAVLWFTPYMTMDIHFSCIL